MSEPGASLIRRPISGELDEVVAVDPYGWVIAHMIVASSTGALRADADWQAGDVRRLRIVDASGTTLHSVIRAL